MNLARDNIIFLLAGAFLINLVLTILGISRLPEQYNLALWVAGPIALGYLIWKRVR